MHRGCFPILLAAVLLAAPAAAGTAAASSAPSALSVGVVGEIGSLNPILASGSAALDILGATSDGLLRYAPVQGASAPAYAWQPDLLSSMPTVSVVGPDGKKAQVTITYRLRPGLRWSDGVPLTSADIRFTWQAIMEPASGAYQAGYNQITSIATPDAQTAVVHMQGTFAAWQTLFSALLPYHALHGRLGGIAADAQYSAHPLATGPFAVQSFTGDTVELAANPFYAGQDGPRPTLQQLDVTFYPSQPALLAALRSHQVAVADLLALGQSDLQSLTSAGLSVASTPATDFEQFTFNLRDPTAQDFAVRKAFYLALDRSAIVAALSGGRWTVATSDQPPWSWAFNPKVPVVSQDVAQAKSLLAEDGWTMGADGYFGRAGQELSLSVWLTRTPLHIALLQMVQQQEARAGIDVLPVYSSAQALFGPQGALAQGTYQVAEFTLMDALDPDDSAIWNSNLGDPSHLGSDFSGYRSSSVNLWTAAALRSMDTSVRAADYGKVQLQLYEDLPMVPLFYTSLDTAYDPTVVQGLQQSAYLGVLWSANSWTAPAPTQP